MEQLIEFALFAGKILVILVALAALFFMVALTIAKAQLHKSDLQIDLLHRNWKQTQKMVRAITQSKASLKEEKKKSKKAKDADEDDRHKPKLFVLDFKGDIRASAVEHFREEISTLLLVAQPLDKVLVRLESPGGVVHGYGLAASQLLRVRDKKIPLTVSIDKVAASGGYLMACTAEKIIGAPFGIVGSIGVVAQVPNFHRVLRKNDIDYNEYTAGEFKRTVSLFGEITPQGEKKFKEQLEDTHQLFKNFVSQNRPQVNIDQVSTGEYWYGAQALRLGLIDEIRTSDDFLLSHLESHQILHLKFEKKQPLRDKLSGIFGQAFKKAALSTWEELEERRWI